MKSSPSSAGGVDSIPGQELKTPLAWRPKSQNIKWNQYCSKFNEDFKLGPHFKNL